MSETLIKTFIVLCWCGILHFSSMEKPFLAIKLIIYINILVYIAISYIIARVRTIILLYIWSIWN